MFKLSSCLKSKGGDLGAYIEVQGDLGRTGKWWTDSGRSGRVKPVKSGPGAGRTGSGTGPSGPNRILGRAATGRGSRSPGIASGWHRSTFRLKTGQAGQGPGQTGPGAGWAGQGPGQTGPGAGRPSSSRLFFLFLPSSFLLLPFSLVFRGSLSQPHLH